MRIPDQENLARRLAQMRFQGGDDEHLREPTFAPRVREEIGPVSNQGEQHVTRWLCWVVVLAFCFISEQALAADPERRVESNVVTSQADPAVRVELPKGVQYLGADRFVLYDIADCELHLFVEANAQRELERRYWIQFEGYLPSKPELQHTYDSTRHATIGGLDFFVDTWVTARDAPVKPGSDGEHVRSLIAAKGYKFPAAGMMSVRLVYLFADKHKELMIIYSEDLSATGLTAADLDEGGKAREQWPAIEKGLIERAEKKISIISTAP